MHTTNNVPQSRCRAFLIYGELSEMGRWSKRRWRHAEGLHFSLFSPHKQEEPVSVCHNTHKTHSHTLLKDTSACTNMYHPHRLHQWHHFHRTHWFPAFPTLRPSPPFSPTAHNKTPLLPLLFQKKMISSPPPSSSLSCAHTRPKSSGFDRTRLRMLGNEPPRALRGVCSK